jgi:hypothetical protein
MRRDERKLFVPTRVGIFVDAISLKPLGIGAITKICKGFPIPCEINSGCENIAVCVGVPSVGKERGQVMSISDDDKAALSNLEAALRPFFKLRPTMPMQYVTAFLLVAHKEGQTVRELAKRAGISVSLMSRHLADLSEVNRYREPGFNLVVGTDDPMDRRTSRQRLTVSGHRVVGQIFGALTR